MTARFAKALVLPALLAHLVHACNIVDVNDGSCVPAVTDSATEPAAGASADNAAGDIVDNVMGDVGLVGGSAPECNAPEPFAVDDVTRALPACPSPAVEPSCTSDCQTTCGFQGLSTRVCACSRGRLESCVCPKPPSYLGATLAPYCQTSDGTSSELDEQPCNTEWAQCIATDPVTGDTPRGCACLVNRETCGLQWFCGSTNGWFELEPAEPSFAEPMPADGRCTPTSPSQ